MHKVILVYLMVLSMTSIAFAQCEAQSDVPVTNAPYSAVRVITTQPKADGTTRSVATQREARDSKGRSYRAGERRWTTNIDGKSVEKSEMLVRISDPVANTETTWDTTTKVAKIVHLPSSNAATSANHLNVDAFSLDATAKRLNGTSMGTRTIEGISVQGIGYRTEESTHECWFSPDLKTVVLQTDQYPITASLISLKTSDSKSLTFRATSRRLATHRATFTLNSQARPTFDNGLLRLVSSLSRHYWRNMYGPPPNLKTPN